MEKLDINVNKYLFVIRLIGYLFIYLFFGIILYFTYTSDVKELFIISAIILGTLSLVLLISLLILPFYTYKMYGYQINDEEVVIIKGVLVRTKTHIPIKRIQHIEKMQGPIQLMFKQASINIYTAGKNESIMGLSSDVSNEVLKNIQNKLNIYLDLDEDLKDE